MTQLSCDTLVEGVIDGCEYHLFAIDQEELELLLKAHLKTDHKAEFESLTEDQLQKIDEKVASIF